MFGLYIEAPFIFIENLHMQSSDYGLIILLQGLSAVLGGIICRKLQIYRVDIEKIKKTAFLLSILSCSFLLITGRLWDLEYIKDLEVIYFVTICIMIQSFSYAMIMPLVLRCALEDYTKTNGTAGSIFGTYYYALVATMNIIITQLHDTSIFKVTIFFLLSSISAFAIHHLMQK
ncbi:MAG: hypothetical protein EB127_09840 [Alphaproteobacteria bacterium]|nr:hypothetical protein [Alphaproteobacteria bacterium]